MSQPEPVRAVALVSGGLDSLLAAKIVSDLGVSITALHCVFRFDPIASERKEKSLAVLSNQLGMQIRHLDISEDMLDIIREPKHGFGKGVNPCIDCHLLMIQKAWALAREIDGRFIVTGEVAGQRPMSQSRQMLRHIEKVSGLEDLILRPLSALALPMTIPEERNWVQRDQLHAIVGRSRLEQIRLAEEYGILDYEQPAGGCILTMPQYADRAKRLWKHKPRADVQLSDMQLLRFGRHLWPNEHLHLIVGRDESENHRLEAFRKGIWSFTAESVQGPLVLAEGIEGNHDIQLAASVTARYSDGKNLPLITVHYDGSLTGKIEITPAKPEETEHWIL